MASNTELKREINFFTALNQYEQQKQKSGKGGKSNVIVAIAVAVILLGGYTCYMVYQDKKLTKTIAELQGFVQNDQNMQVFTEQSKLQNNLAALTAYNEACLVYIKELKDKPRVAGVNFARVKDQLPANVTMTEWSYTDPVLTVTCETLDKNAPSKFAESLTKAGDFADVTYEGFDSLGQIEGDVYTFAIKCKLW